MSTNKKDTGIIRCIDDIGRLVIPAELRREMGLLVGEPVHMYVEDGRVIVEKYRKACFICGKYADRYTVVCKKRVCDTCKLALNGIDAETENDLDD